MSETPSELRRATITAMRASAKRLMTAAQDDSTKAAIGQALEDLDQASGYLTEPHIESGKPLLALVDMAIRQASYRLHAVAKGLRLYGPDV
jgi:hypothetical protein